MLRKFRALFLIPATVLWAQQPRLRPQNRKRRPAGTKDDGQLSSCRWSLHRSHALTTAKPKVNAASARFTGRTPHPRHLFRGWRKCGRMPKSLQRASPRRPRDRESHLVASQATWRKRPTRTCAVRSSARKRRLLAIGSRPTIRPPYGSRHRAPKRFIHDELGYESICGKSIRSIGKIRVRTR